MLDDRQPSRIVGKLVRRGNGPGCRSAAAATPALTMPANQNMYDRLARFIRNAGGFVTSVPGQWPIRCETRPNSKLAVELAHLGPTVRFVGTAERIDPFLERIYRSIDIVNGQQVVWLDQQPAIVMVNA